MATTSKFQGKFMYYENINGKEKKVSKEFSDVKKFNDFAKKYPMPTLSSMFGLAKPALTGKPNKKALPAKKCCGSCGTKAKKPAKKKK
ncbi:MAG: hypothetical protein WC606_01430 [Candidatus Absconditabacterales bacterium]